MSRLETKQVSFFVFAMLYTKKSLRGSRVNESNEVLGDPGASGQGVFRVLVGCRFAVRNGARAMLEPRRVEGG